MIYKNDLIKTNIHTCVGCNKCMRICPVDTANIAYMDRHGRIKVRTDNTKCLACGACISVCHRRARYYLDDTERFFKDLQDGKQISLLVLPSFATNFPDYKIVINYLREMGVNMIYDVSLGVDIYIWAHLRHIEKVHPFTMITTYCPILTSYCELHRPELLPRLSPIRSPSSILAIYLRDILKNNDDMAVVSPCLSKQTEFDNSKENLKYSLTFSKLREHILKTNPKGLKNEESDFDILPQSIGSAVSLNYGFHRNIDFLAGNSFRVDHYSGLKVFRILDIYAASDPDDVPQILDLVSCELGCNFGPGHLPDLNNFKINKIAFNSNNILYSPEIRERYDSLHKYFDNELNLPSFYHQYTPTSLIQDYIPEDRVEQAFLTLGKRTMAQRTIDCYACGSTTCRDMAIRIALGVNIPQNCINLAKETISATNKRFTDYLQLIRVMGEYMLASGQGDDKLDSIENSLMALCSALNASRASIWKNSYNDRELPTCDIIISFPGVRHSILGVITTDNLPDWLEAMADGEILIKSAARMTPLEKNYFTDSGYENICCVPIMVDGDFWGFLMIVRGALKPFSTEELHVIESASFLIISNLISTMPNDSEKSEGLHLVAL
jgi:NAD-dependent dihydropyrimidine dehydrogenase PreA subunit